MPTNDLIDAALVFSAGVLLFVPGFVTDAFGLLLLFPPTRHVARVAAQAPVPDAHHALRLHVRPTAYGPGPPGNVIDV